MSSAGMAHAMQE